METLERHNLLLVVKSTELASKLEDEFCATAKAARKEVNRRVTDSILRYMRCGVS